MGLGVWGYQGPGVKSRFPSALVLMVLESKPLGFGRLSIWAEKGLGLRPECQQ